jgi:hypothetical protein
MGSISMVPVSIIREKKNLPSVKRKICPALHAMVWLRIRTKKEWNDRADFRKWFGGTACWKQFIPP